MNNTQKTQLNKGHKVRNSIFGTALGLLVIVTVISAILLTVRLVDYIKVDDRAVSLRSSMDEKLDVFALEYRNDTGEITVKGSDGTKVIAPGTDIEYTLRLRNTDEVALDYVYTPEVNFSSEYKFPLLVRLLDPEDNYVIGSETEWVPIDQVNAIEEKGTLLVNETAEYVFQWKWPFESGDDAYDTFLGSVSVENDAGLSLSFNLHSEANLTANANSGFMKAPLTKVLRALLVFILLVAAIVLLVIYIIKRIKANREEKPKTIEIIKTVEVPVAQAVPAPAPAEKKIGFVGKMAYVNLDTLDENFNSGDRITIKVLKEKGIIPQSTKQIKILSRISTPLQKAFIIETQGISKEAEIAVRCAGGKVIIAAPEGVEKKQ